MNRYAIDACLNELATEGQWLVGGDNRQKALVWFARAGGVLSAILPADSELRKTFDEAASVHLGDTSAKLPQQAVDLLRVASELNRLRRDEGILLDLRQDVQTVIAETFVKSWWFRLPIAILVTTIAFALVGVVQISNMSIDVRQHAEAAAKKAEDDIAAQRDRTQKSIAQIGDNAREAVQSQITSALRDSTTAAKTQISAAALARVNELKEQKAPELEAAFATARFSTDSSSEGLRLLMRVSTTWNCAPTNLGVQAKN
jgi:hypothetical protein